MVSSDAGESHVIPSSAGRVPGVPLVLRINERVQDASAPPSTEPCEEVLIVDPVTRSHATFACEGVFVASSLEPTVVLKGEKTIERRRRDQQCFSGDQEILYEHLFAHVARDTRASAHRSHLFLTYGQTSSGKTYSLFGPASGASAASAAGPSPTAGIVPRFFHDVFSVHDEGVFVDLTCMEVYNEVTTDVAALALEQARAAREAPPPPPRRRHSQLSRSEDASASVIAFAELNAVEDAFSQYTRHAQAAQYENDALCGGGALDACGGPALHQVTYKVTEKNKLRRSCVRLRCTSAAQCGAVTEQLLALRQSSLTERNAHSSRGHLLLRAEVYTAADSRPTVHREVLFVDLAGSESQRDASGIVPPSSSLNAKGSADSSGNRVYRRTLSGGSTRSVGGMSTDSVDRRPVCHSRRGSLSSNNNSFGHGLGSLDNTALGTTTASLSGLQRDVGHRRSASLTAAARLNPAVEKMRCEAATQKRSQELRHINTSLLALRKVIHAFHEASRQRRPPRTLHAPFKDSTLTTILEPYLIPSVQASSSMGEDDVVLWPDIVFLVCCSSQQRDFHETISSLRLGAEASTVKPTVVLQTLPACRPVATPASHTNLTGRPFTRSHSAPVRCASVGSAVKSEGDERRRGSGPQPFVRSHSRTGSAGPAAPQHAPAPPTPAVPSAFALDAAEREELLRLRSEVQSYKATAVDLYEQCRQLCENYARSVKELAAAKAAQAEKDAVIADLTAQLHAHQRPPPPQQPQYRPTVNAAVLPSAATRVSTEANSGCVREVSVPRVTELTPAVRGPCSVTPWSDGRDIVISADTSCQRSPSQATTAVSAMEAARDVSPPPRPSSSESKALSDSAHNAVLQALLQRQLRLPVEGNTEADAVDTAVAAAVDEAPHYVSRGLSAADLNCAGARAAKSTGANVAASSSTEAENTSHSSSGGTIPCAPPSHVFRL